MYELTKDIRITISKINPFKANKKYNCFSCGQTFRLGMCEIGNRITQEVLHDVPSGWWAELRAHILFETLDGPFYVPNFASRRCPHCKKYLPPNMENARNIIIAVLGDGAVGKTHYIAACIDQMNPRGPLRHLHEVIECLAINQDVKEKYRSTLYDPLFENLTPLGITESIQFARTEEEKLNDPLIYTLTIRKGQRQKTYNLVFYDASGEDLRDEKILLHYKLYALNPDAIIYIADPLTIPSIESRTPYKKVSKLPPDEVLRETIHLIQQYQRLRGASPTLPIAITLSKSDLLEYIEPPDASFRFLDDPNYVGGLDMDDIEVVNQEIQELLSKYGEHGLLNAKRLSEHAYFFATSATGSAPDPTTNQFSDVKPRRCLDPLLWILFQLGVISAKGDNPS